MADMARDIIDDRLIGALHIRSLTHQGLVHDPAAEHQAIQAGTIDALLAGNYEGDTTIGEVLRAADLGIGTVQQLDGELMLLDGQAWLAQADGSLRPVEHDERTPFIVACAFRADETKDQTKPLDFTRLRQLLDDMASDATSVVAFRIDGEFESLELRSVHRQEPPYPPLADVVAHQTQWSVSTATGTVMGFRFPDATAGLEVPGYHLHFLSADRLIGGHVLSLDLVRGRLAMQECDSLHVELPPGVALGVPGATDRATITRLESAPD